MRSFFTLAVALTFGSLGVLGTPEAQAFSQYSPVTPIGHEYLVVSPARDRSLAMYAELNPSRAQVTGSSANCGVGCTDYGTKSFAVWSAIIGQRWVDTMGFGMKPGTETRCFDAVAQSNDGIMYDHFLRMRNDFNGCGANDGRTRSIKGSVARFRQYFKDAALADDSVIRSRDGGFTTAHYKVMRAYFLFGRAVHLFQDSFSTEHAVRSATGEILDIKSYFCMAGVPLHKHSYTARAMGEDSYAQNGDVIWKSSVGNTDDNLKPHAEMARRAMVDLWGAFMRAHKSHGRIDPELEFLTRKWFSFREGLGSDPATLPTPAALAACTFPTAAKIAFDVQACLKWTGRNPTSSIVTPFDWSVTGFTDTVYDSDLPKYPGKDTDTGGARPPAGPVPPSCPASRR